MASTVHTPVMRAPDGAQLRAFIYDRVSRLNPRGGNSVQDQNLDNQRLCEAHGWSIVDVFEDPGKSASRYAKGRRPDYDDMIKRARDGECDVIVVWEASRAYRDSRTYLDLRDLFEKQGILLCYNGRLYDMARSDDRFATHIDALMAEREADAIRDRNLRTVRLNAERGRPHGRVPYGWRREYDPGSGALLRQSVDEHACAVVVECSRRVAAGQSLYAIAKDMNARGEPGPAAAVPWTASTVRSLVLRASNIGARQYRGQVIGPAQWDAIVPDDLYYACVNTLTQPSRATHRDPVAKFLMSGIARCGACNGDRAALRPQRNVRKDYWSYACRACFGVAIKASTLDDAVTIALLKHVERPAFAAALVRDDGGSLIRRAVAEAAALEGQLAAARELSATVVDGRIAMPAAEFVALAARLTPRIEAARARARDEAVPAAVQRVAGPGAREVWGRMNLAERRTVIREVVGVTVNRVGRGFGGVREGRITWDWLR